MGLYIFVDEEEPQEAHMQVSGTGLYAGAKSGTETLIGRSNVADIGQDTAVLDRGQTTTQGHTVLALLT